MTRYKAALLLVLAIYFIGGCGKIKRTDTEIGSGQTAPGDQAMTEGVDPGSDFFGVETQGIDGQSQGGQFADAPWNDPGNTLSNRVIYFDFDSSEVRPEYFDVISTHAQYVSGASQVSVILEGHADERGTREYNIALGEQRAISISKMMKLQGVQETQIRVLSYGEEKPDSLEHNENGWNLNRRVEIAYPGQ